MQKILVGVRGALGTVGQHTGVVQHPWFEMGYGDGVSQNR